MKEAGLIIDLYQSPIQDESAVKKAVSDFYNPLIKLLKSNKRTTVSLNIPLSTLEVLDKFGYGSLISEIKELYENDRVEIVGAPPYNSLITQFSKKIIEDQIILNEYGVGYYLGSKQGFEGEPSIMIRDLEGFMPAGYVVNENLLDTLEDFGYRWVGVDGSISPGKLHENTEKSIDNNDEILGTYCHGYPFAYEIEGRNVAVVRIFNDLMLLIVSFNKDENNLGKNFIIHKKEISGKFNDILTKVWASEKDGVVFRMGNSLFGNFGEGDSRPDGFKESFEGIDLLLELLEKNNIKICSVRDLLRSKFKMPLLSGEDFISIFEDNTTKYYDKKYKVNNKISVVEMSMSKILEDYSYNYKNDDFNSICMWKDEDLGLVTDSELLVNIRRFILFSRFICLGKYIYSNEVNNNINNSKINLDKIKKFVSFATGFVENVTDKGVAEELTKKIDDLSEFIDSAK